jgi:hypothetical protein
MIDLGELIVDLSILGVAMGQGGSDVSSILGTANQIAASSPTGTVTLSLVSNPILPGTGGVTLPGGTTAQRAGGAGTIRLNSQTNVFESTVDGTNWATIETSVTGVTSVSGTLNRITSTGGTTPVIDISASYVGQSSITTLGTISTGIWNGTLIGSTFGGTGVDNGSSTLTLAGNLATSGAFASTFTMTAATNVTFPTSGTLLTSSGAVTSITGTTSQIIASSATGDVTLSLPQSIATTSSVQFATIQVPEVLDANGKEVFSFVSTANAVNFLSVANNITGNTPILRALGTDSNISMALLMKGNGQLFIETAALTTPLTILSGTSSQHITNFLFANTSATDSYTFPDVSGTMTVLGNTATGTGSVVLANTPTLITPVLGAATGTSIVLSGNDSANNFFPGYNTFTTSQTLTINSPYSLYMTGSTSGQSFTMPVVTTFSQLGAPYMFMNNSTQSWAINSSGGNLIVNLPSNSMVILQCVLLTGTTAASWNVMPITYVTVPISAGGTGQTTASAAITALGGVGLASVNTYTAAQQFAFNTLTFASTVAINLSLANNYYLTLTGNATLGVPTNPVAGQSGVINVRQDITGSRTLAYSWPYQFVGGVAPTLSTGKLVFDQLMYMVNNYSTSTVTVTIATPAVMTWTSHGLVSGQRIQLATTGALPTGLTAATTYWVTVIDANTFNLSTSLANAQSATFIATSGSQSGTQTATNFSITLTINPAVA